MHADDARPHTAQLSAQFFEQNKMKTAPHPPHSHDLTTSDFYLFGYVKGCLASFRFESAYEPLEAVQGVL
jgi:hypothetical protein